MKIRIYQIDVDKDENGVAFESYDRLAKLQGTNEIQSEIYGKVFDGEVYANDLEDVYSIFNIDKPADYSGRSLSVSDIVEVIESDSTAPGYYFCDSIGFELVDFDPEKADKTAEEKITVIKLEPGKEAYVTQIGTSLEQLQKTVGGDIETFYPFDPKDRVLMVVNDEGKFNGMEPCRAVYDEDGKIMDIVFGPCFICADKNYAFASLPEDMQKKYMEMFKQPERFFRKNGEIVAVKYEPVKDEQER